MKGRAISFQVKERVVPNDVYSASFGNRMPKMRCESDHDSINLQSVRQWCKIDMKNIPPPPPVLLIGNPGITVNIANNASILNYFELFLMIKLRMIVQETNRYAEQYIHKTVCKEESRWKKWTETNIEEKRCKWKKKFAKKPESGAKTVKLDFALNPVSNSIMGCGSPVVKVSNHGRHVMSSIQVPLKTRRVGQRCTLNLSRAETSSRWCGVVVRRGGCQLRCRPRHLTMVQNYVVRRQKPSCS
ncbi:uncharacterized protein TNCV_4796561 [Trichonephila clavipes]|nr:uncharacterized protein TNCV_4796561 [Trichonephila clavipes]